MGSASALAALPRPPLSPSGPISSLFPTFPYSRPLLSLVLRSAQHEASSSEPSLEEEKKGGGGFGGKKIKKRKGMAAVVRRSPITKPQLVAGADDKKSGASEQQQHGLNERAFLLTWLGLGALILVEGIALAASGFLPEQWDSFFVKYLYPSFTPTVFVFVGGTVAYGVSKYLQNEQLKG